MFWVELSQLPSIDIPQSCNNAFCPPCKSLFSRVLGRRMVHQSEPEPSMQPTAAEPTASGNK